MHKKIYLGKKHTIIRHPDTTNEVYIKANNTMDSLIAKADKALYLSKEMGKNLVN